MKDRKTQEKKQWTSLRRQATEADTMLDPAPGTSSIIREKYCISQGPLEEKNLQN